jgi:hypothetical protein
MSTPPAALPVAFLQVPAFSALTARLAAQHWVRTHERQLSVIRKPHDAILDFL